MGSHESALAVEATSTQPALLLKARGLMNTTSAFVTIVIVTAVGAYLPYVWFGATAAMWISSRWSRWDKIIATAISPLVMTVTVFFPPLFAVAYPASFIATAIWLLIRGANRGVSQNP